MKKTKTNALQAALDRASVSDSEMDQGFDRSERGATDTPRLAQRGHKREGTVLIGGHFPKSVQMQLKILAAEEDATHQELIREALDLLFVKKGKRQIIEH